MRQKRLILVLISCITILGLMVATSPVLGAITLTFSSYLPSDDPAAQALHARAREIEAKTNGEIRIKIYPSSQLRKIAENFDAVAKGAVDMAFTGLAGEDDKVPLFGVLGLPYAFPSLEAAMKSCRGGLNDFLDKEANKVGVKIISVGFFTYPHCFIKNKPLLTPADYRGARISVTSVNIGNAIKMLGGIPVVMPDSDVYTALQRGVVDGHVGTVAAVLSGKFYTVEHYGIISPLGIGPVHVIANLKTWNKLSSAQQRIIEQSLNDMADDLLVAFRKETVESGVRRLRQHGMKIHVQGAEDMDPFRYALEPLYERYRERTGEKGRQALNLIAFFPFSAVKIP